MEEFRLCKHCNKELPLTSEYFYKNKTHKGGFDYKCKDCKREYDKLYQKEYYDKNKSKINEKRKKCKEENAYKTNNTTKQYKNDIVKRKKDKYYNKWLAMIKRCCDSNFKIKYPTYKECKVCEEWLEYSNFKKWHDENYYEIEDEKTHLDKDILIKGNKVYSPKTCVFVPQRINTLFTKSNKRRSNLPIGVKKDKNAYVAQCSIGGNKNKKYLGRFETSEEAFNSYKQFKEQYIKEIADEYNGRIPQILYDAMYKYEVEITD